MNFPSQIFFNDINHGYRAAILKRNVYVCFHYIWLWLVISVMKRFAERCILQLHQTSLTILTWKNLCFTEISTKFIEIKGWLLLTFFICLHNQLSSFNSIIVQVSEKRDWSNNSKDEWLLLSVIFTAKLKLVFVLKFENGFS